ncbi:MAG: hypothetical protein A2Y19_05570 [Firmicutes bacterium GWE2_51_13]|nr:MAG: hypothetical protein A2Y19_05570 [Firmicutes bacterium GWE2_51_13]
MSINDNIIKLMELKGVSVVELQTEGEANYIHLEIPIQGHACPSCGTSTRYVHDYREQKVLDVPLYNKPTYLLYRKRRYRCPTCGKRFFGIGRVLLSRYILLVCLQTEYNDATQVEYFA